MEWESGFFGYPVARIELTEDKRLPEVLRQLTHKGYKLACWFLPETESGLQHVALQNHGILVDRKVTFSRRTPDIELIRSSRERISVPVEIDPEGIKPDDLYELAFLAGSYSRFKTDTRFPSGSFKKMYTMWVLNSLNKTLADHTLVVRDEKGTAGFLTLKTGPETSKIGLISVDPGRQKQGIGRALILESFVISATHNLKTIEVVTQLENTGACEFYSKSGFGISNIQYIYHFWLQ